MTKIREVLLSTLIIVLSQCLKVVGMSIQCIVNGISALGNTFVAPPIKRETYGEIFFEDLYERDIFEPLLHNPSPELEESLRTLKYSSARDDILEPFIQKQW